MTTAFQVGDQVGQTEGETAVQVEILTIEPSTITARVIVLGTFFSARRLQGANGRSLGFVLGEVLTFRPTGCAPDSWVIDLPQVRPWHTLDCIEGRKTFLHYR